MIYSFRILPLAEQDVDAAALHIAQDNLEQAMHFYDAVNDTYKMILSAPNRWPIYELTHSELHNLRKRSVRGFKNYLVFYRVDESYVEIVRVLHGARDLPALFEMDQ